MNPGRLTDDAHGLAGRYVRFMQAVRRLAGGDPGLIVDAGMGIAGAGLIAVAAWGPVGLVGTKIAGPPWLLVLLPLLVGAALALRRRAPLLMWIAIWAGIALQDLITRQPPQDLEFLFVLFVGAYSLGAHAGLRRAATGLVISAAMILTSAGCAAGLLAASGRIQHKLVLPPDPGLLAGRRARPRPQAVRSPGRA